MNAGAERRREMKVREKGNINSSSNTQNPSVQNTKLR